MKKLLASLLAVGIFALMFTVVTSAPITSPAYAGKMNGKPGGGRNSAHYDQPKPKKQKAGTPQ